MNFRPPWTVAGKRLAVLPTDFLPLLCPRTGLDGLWLADEEKPVQTGTTVSDSAARRAARRAGYVARKSRRGKYSCDNFGDFMIVDPDTNAVVAGARFELTAADVVELCREY